MNEVTKKILEQLKSNSSKLELYKEGKKLLLDYITNLQEERDRTLGALNDLHSLYHYKFDKILEQIKIVEDADLSEHNFCKFIDKVKNIIQGSDKE